MRVWQGCVHMAAGHDVALGQVVWCMRAMGNGGHSAGRPWLISTFHAAMLLGAMLLGAGHALHHMPGMHRR